ncbi:glycosyltransferase family 2 protein [Saccharothrix algeriensis]|uniref:Glycosyltransferase n=1 Tax=Saccharothrix algeriensis TaxID=173560 RepID=A0A8T8I045_9PSEU|nr:glycosyltransferase family 2 protein [Saccharothrix algeriensis]MBM7809772.1 cellulose synthase/poly-beta-1,6-N-acetylglucosamine synthase-like glycosyltransferase [Saccharothrix algeriensis]QTR04048.1 glycosyltransferase [Saccharothrix algeriensis]
MTTGSPPHQAGHPVLPERFSARRLLGRGQRVALAAVSVALAGAVVAGAVTAAAPSPLWWARASVAAVTAVYVVLISFRCLLVIAGPGARIIRARDGARTPDRDLPPYTVLLPVHREAVVLPKLVETVHRLDYPAQRLQVLLLVEQDDEVTRAALDRLDLPPEFEVVLVPEGGPRTKPNACNAGLARATGELCVIYDAEDRPEADQLRKAAAALEAQPDRVVCVQAELAYWNPWTNWLTRHFAAEYAVNFALALRGLDRFRLPIPLGGTSNHFRVDALRVLGGWDPHNVTEDADLGVRIARRGWEVRIFDSVTYEEANSELGNWVRQRSRWIKGYLQTWLVHMRDPWRLLRDLGPRGFLAFQLTFGFTTLTTLVNPLFWSLTCLYLVTGPELIQPLFTPAALYAGTAAMLAGNLAMLYQVMAGCMQRDLHRAVPTMLTVPLYWALMSVAAYKALVQLLRPGKRHHWELTRHGLVGEHGERHAPLRQPLD